METARHTERLAANAEVISRLLSGVSREQARWKPAPGRWSLLEVVNHLHDEEREDFRARLDLLWHRPDQPWPANDPFGWVEARGYNQRDLTASLRAFVTEREQSVRWLGSLSHPAWQAAHAHPQLGTLRAGDIMVSWVAHDFFHIRQITNLLWESLTATAAPYSTAYAGPYDWSPGVPDAPERPR